MKKFKLVIFLLILLTINLSTGFAQNPTDETPKNSEKTEKLTAKDYDEMVKKTKSGDLSVDFHKMRLAYTETEQYSPYGGSSERQEISKLLNEKNYKKALTLSEERLEKHFVDLNVLYYALIASEELKNNEKTKFYTDVFKKMLSDIFDNGDGLSAKTAIFAIGVSEQYFIMSVKGFQRNVKALTRENGSVFDVHTAVNPKTNETRKFYFNIDKVFGRF